MTDHPWRPTEPPATWIAVPDWGVVVNGSVFTGTTSGFNLNTDLGSFAPGTIRVRFG